MSIDKKIADRFIKMITAIETELAYEYMPECLAWVDEKTNGAFSAEVERFEKAIEEFSEKHDHEKYLKQIEWYQENMVYMINLWKKEKGIDETKNFIEALGHEYTVSETKGEEMCRRSKKTSNKKPPST